MDATLVLHELDRAEAQRKLDAIPAEALDTAWVREAQIEAVIDAVLLVAHGRTTALAHARHVGEWCARIARALPLGPNPTTARRVGALAGIGADRLEAIPELRHLAAHVADYQRFDVDRPARRAPSTMTLIVSVASEFDGEIATERRSAASILRSILDDADDARGAIAQALARAVGYSTDQSAVA